MKTNKANKGRSSHTKFKKKAHILKKLKMRAGSAKMKQHLAYMGARKLLRNKKVIEEINRHKWLESEIAGYDIGFEAATEDWLKRHAEAWIAYHADHKAKPSPKRSILPKNKKRSPK